MADKNIFQRIIDREIPADIVYEDDLCLAFRDIHPQAPTHLIVIPKKAIHSAAEITAEDASLVGHLFVAMQQAAAAAGRRGETRDGCGRWLCLFSYPSQAGCGGCIPVPAQPSPCHKGDRHRFRHRAAMVIQALWCRKRSQSPPACRNGNAPAAGGLLALP